MASFPNWVLVTDDDTDGRLDGNGEVLKLGRPAGMTGRPFDETLNTDSSIVLSPTEGGVVDLRDEESAAEIDFMFSRCISTGQLSIHGSDLVIGRKIRSDEMEAIHRLQLLVPNQSSPTLALSEDMREYITIEEDQEIASNQRLPANDYLVIDLEDEEERLLNELVTSDSPSSPRPSAAIPRRNESISPPFVEILKRPYGNTELREGKVVELSDGRFLLIKRVFQNLEDDAIKLRGYLFARNKTLCSMLPRKLNEICWICDLDLDDPREASVQSMVEKQLSDVVGVRRIRLTNQLFPHSRDREFECQSSMAREGMLIARWQFIRKYVDARARLNELKPEEFVIERLKECGLGSLKKVSHPFVEEERLRSGFRGETISGGAYTGGISSGGSGIVTGVNALPGQRRAKMRHRSREDGDEISEISSAQFHAEQHLKRKQPEESQQYIPELEEVVERLRETSIDSFDIYGSVGRSSNDAATYSERHIIRLPTRPRHPLPHGASLKRSSSSCAMPASGFIMSNAAASRLRSRTRQQRYTFGDCFCGAGGASRGAVMAGLVPIWGFDFNSDAAKAYHCNFPETTVYNMWADEVIRLAKGGDLLKVDILHLSPPCQFYSPAHTIMGKDDDMNMASLFAVGPLLDAAKPRIATLEQTFGLATCRFEDFFNALLCIFTERNFSVRWKICRLQCWGLPQRRLRLIIIASCPGEILPEFPGFTHSSDPFDGLKPFHSVNDAIRGISTPRHLFDLNNSRCPPRRSPWVGDSIAPRCITTSGGQNYHPSGLRNFTRDELAALQGFPPGHQFGNGMLRQIGNAFAPSIAKVILAAVRQALEKADGVTDTAPQGSSITTAVSNDS